MKHLKHLKFILYFLLYILVGAILLTIINLIVGLSNKTNEVISLIYMGVYSLFFGIRNTLKSSNNYLLTSLKHSLIHIGVIYLLGSILFGFGFTKERLLYYLIIMGILLLGTMIGIKLKKE